jgi:Rhomboid family
VTGRGLASTTLTSGGGAIEAVLYALMLMCAVWAALALALLAAGGPAHLTRRLPAAALGLWLAVAVPSLLQLAFPELLQWLERQPAMIRQGQVWRLVTSAVVQDGGIAGMVFNLAALAVIAVVAVRLWGAGRALAIFVAGLLAFNLLATYVSPSTGAGNSGATFTLATSVTGLAAVVLRRPLVAGLAALTAADGAMLLALRDAHGVVVVGGLLLGALVGALSPPTALTGLVGANRSLRTS